MALCKLLLLLILMSSLATGATGVSVTSGGTEARAVDGEFSSETFILAEVEPMLRQIKQYLHRFTAERVKVRFRAFRPSTATVLFNDPKALISQRVRAAVAAAAANSDINERLDRVATGGQAAMQELCGRSIEYLHSCSGSELHGKLQQTVEEYIRQRKGRLLNIAEQNLRVLVDTQKSTDDSNPAPVSKFNEDHWMHAALLTNSVYDKSCDLFRNRWNQMTTKMSETVVFEMIKMLNLCPNQSTAAPVGTPRYFRRDGPVGNDVVHQRLHVIRRLVEQSIHDRVGWAAELLENVSRAGPLYLADDVIMRSQKAYEKLLTGSIMPALEKNTNFKQLLRQGSMRHRRLNHLKCESDILRGKVDAKLL
jgi:hypothetical protein